MVLATAFYLPMTLLAPLPEAQADAITASAPENPAVELDWPGYGASAVGAVGFPEVFATGGSQKPRTIASITKVITSLVVLAKKPIADGTDGPTLTMTSADAALYGSYLARNGEVKPVRAGLKLSERQVLQVVLIASANNYAESLSTWAFGSQRAFLAAAADWLAKKGLTSTTLQDSSGMNPGNKSTTRDLIELAKLALADPVVSTIVSTRSVTLPYIGTVANTNALLGNGGINGIKTGTLPEAGACLLFSSTIQVGEHSVTLVGVILGGTDHPSLDVAVRRLLSSAKAGFRELPLVTAGEPFYSYSTPWEQSARAVATRDGSVLAWAGTKVTVRSTSEAVRDGAVGQSVGSVTYTVGTSIVTVPLALDDVLGDPGPWWRLTHPFG
ncbi:D-alanyl-D-alanine carboxypeptidase [Terrimesophilobacter mesophilus]|uniref:D-alanyl-D-alanine carboxypeptidase n=1 Tax=Terrimesophilobacter mesophilus TaxID=433647 RepID=A0A4V3I9T1_9MICO|nr:D-alanyl-D-alanine carboxypeptidase [Terrimesophilobacter mesophilus]